jgi:hypothetical protein
MTVSKSSPHYATDILTGLLKLNVDILLLAIFFIEFFERLNNFIKRNSLPHPRLEYLGTFLLLFFRQ